MPRAMENKGRAALKQAGWWLLFFACALYAAYALSMGAVEILLQLGFVADAPVRAVPIVFVMHALAGSIVLLVGPLQFNRRLLAGRPKLHRLSGRSYVVGVWIASICGLWSAVFFDVPISARISFGLLAILWFSTTTIALLRILRREIAAHREWMIRSFSLSLFFLSFSVWVPGLAASSLPEAVSYPLAVFFSWSLNLAAAELWIRFTRSRAKRLTINTKSGFVLQGIN